MDKSSPSWKGPMRRGWPRIAHGILPRNPFSNARQLARQDPLQCFEIQLGGGSGEQDDRLTTFTSELPPGRDGAGAAVHYGASFMISSDCSMVMVYLYLLLNKKNVNTTITQPQAAAQASTAYTGHRLLQASRRPTTMVRYIHTISY